MQKLKQKDTYAKIKALGLSVRKTACGEHRISQGSEASAYYTDDLQDALDTARLIAASKVIAAIKIA